MKKNIFLSFLISFLVLAGTANAISVIQPYGGGTGTSTAPTLGQVLIGTASGVYRPVATSSLGITSALWGNITGTLSSQTDLQDALNAKLATTTADSTYLKLSGGTMTGNLNMTSGLQYQYNGLPVIIASTTLGSYFFARAGNLSSLTPGASSNIGIGNTALSSLTSGSSNTAIGIQTMSNATSTSGNVAIGNSSLVLGGGGEGFNTAIGLNTLGLLSTGDRNTAVGAYAGKSDFFGSDNESAFESIYIGYMSMSSSTDNNSIVIGSNAVSHGSDSTTIGNSSTTESYIYGNINVASGKSLCLSGTCNSTWPTGGTTNLSPLIVNGSVAGINATSSTYAFLAQGTTSLNAFGIASSSGTMYLTVNSSGNAGLGTTTPSAKFDIYGATSSSLVNVFNVASSSNASLFTVRSNGNVGVGVAAAYKLDVLGDINIPVTGTYISSAYKIGGINMLNSYHGNSNYFLFNAGNANSQAYNNIGIGNTALQALAGASSGNRNLAIGNLALRDGADINDNVAIGYDVLQPLASAGGGNVGVGTYAFNGVSSGSNNTAIGDSTGRSDLAGSALTNISSSTFLGGKIRAYAVTGNENQIVIGYLGRSIGNNTTVIGNSKTTATALWGNLGIGTTSTSSIATSQVYVVGTTTSTYFSPNSPFTVVTGSTSGTSTFSMPFTGASYKKVIVYLDTLNGTASYTFPIPFTYKPQILSEDLAATVTSLTSTSTTITGAPSTGFIELTGF